MRLTHQLGRGTKVHLLLDDEYQITTSTTFWAEHYLPDGTEISEDDWQRLVQQINELFVCLHRNIKEAVGNGLDRSGASLYMP